MPTSKDVTEEPSEAAVPSPFKIPPILPPTEPFRGIEPFRFCDQIIFSERRDQASRLQKLVFIYRGTLLAGGSGVGKSSLVNAGFLPAILQEGFLPERVRVQPKPGAEFQAERIPLGEADQPPYLPSRFISESLHEGWIAVSAEQFTGTLSTSHPAGAPLLVFDQFEELITLFDETPDSPDKYQAAEIAQAVIIRTLARLLQDPTLPVKFLFVFREDYYLKLGKFFDRVPGLREQGMYLEPLPISKLKQLIREPFALAAAAGKVFDRPIGDALADEIATAIAAYSDSHYVNLTEVQIICQTLWRDPQGAANFSAAPNKVQHIQTLLELYIDGRLARLTEELRDPAIGILTRLITALDTRNIVAEPDLIERLKDEDDVPPEISIKALNELVSNSRLVNRQKRGDTAFYDIVSEFLIPWIRRRRDARRDLAARRREAARQQQLKVRQRARLIAGIGGAAVAGLIGLIVAMFSLWRHAYNEGKNAGESGRIALARNLAGASYKYRHSDLGLALLLNLEAARIADEINPKTPSRAEAKANLLAEVKGGLLSGLVFSPHLRMFLHSIPTYVRSVAFSPNGKILATGGYDHNVTLWDLGGYPLGPSLSGHDAVIYSVAFSPNGKKVASCGGDGKIILWDVEQHKQIKSVQLGEGELDNVAFSPDGNTLVCGAQTGAVVLLDVEGHETHTLSGHKGRVYSVAFSPNGKQLASSGEDSRIIFWDLNSRQPEGAVIEDTNEVFSIAFSPDGKTLASGNRDSEVTFWNVAERQRLGSALKEHTQPVFSVAFSPDGKTLVSASIDTTIRRWDVDKRAPMGEPLTGSSEPIYAVAFSPDGRTLASGADHGVTVLWDITSQSLLAQPLNLGWIYRVALSPDGKTVVAGDLEGCITVMGESVYESYERFEAHQKNVTSLAFTSDGTTLASAGADGSIQLRSSDGKTWNRSPRSLLKQAESVNSIAFSPRDNRTLASGDKNGLVIFWDVPSGKEVGTLPKQEAAVNTIAFSPDRKTLASGSEDGTIVLWNVDTRQRVISLEGQRDSVSSVAFSPDGKVLASGGRDYAVILWDVVTGQPLYVFREHTAPVRSVAFSPDGKVLASSSDDKIILWDVAARESIGPLVTEDKNERYYAVAFSPDGQLISAGWGVTYWDVRLESLRSNAEQIAGRNLTLDEWKRFLGDMPYRPTSVYGLLKEADRLALQGDVQKARSVFKQVVGMAVKNGDAVVNNQVAWYGTLDNLADIVLPACSRAIELAKAEDKPLYRDTHGVALALTRKFPEAIEDLEATVTWLKDTEKRYLEEKTEEGKKNAAEYKKMREKREEWIVKLKSRPPKNPFDAPALMNLRREGEASERQ